jgi:bifunctional non-homologous end joining protein LigD
MARVSTLPKRLQPMLATLTDAPFDDPDWVFEDKYDGFRMVASIEGGKVTLYSRNGKMVSENYRDVARALERVKGDAVLDGELVALDAGGVSRFQLLQNALRHEARLIFYLFDVMFAGSEDLRNLPLTERKKRLKPLLPKHKLIGYSEHRKRLGSKFFAEAEERGLEGIMAKRADSTYRSGERTTNWLKIKTANRQEAVIAGFTAPRRSRRHFGALVLAVRDEKQWRYVGNVGAGFSLALLAELQKMLAPLITPRSPFGAKIKNQGVTTWVKPKIVAEIKFTEWTTAGEMRHPVFLGLRTDKHAEDVVLEKELKRRSK